MKNIFNSNRDFLLRRIHHFNRIKLTIWTICAFQDQDKSSDIEQQPPFGDRKTSNIQPQNRGGGVQNQQEHHIILTKYEAVHPTAVSENNSSSGMLII